MKNSKGEEILLFCDNPACFATHLAEKQIDEEKGDEK